VINEKLKKVLKRVDPRDLQDIATELRLEGYIILAGTFDGVADETRTLKQQAENEEEG